MKAIHYSGGGFIINPRTKYATYLYPHPDCAARGAHGRFLPRRGGEAVVSTAMNPEAVTCKRCLAFIAKCRLPGSFLGNPDDRPRTP